MWIHSTIQRHTYCTVSTNSHGRCSCCCCAGGVGAHRVPHWLGSVKTTYGWKYCLSPCNFPSPCWLTVVRRLYRILPKHKMFFYYLLFSHSDEIFAVQKKNPSMNHTAKVFFIYFYCNKLGILFASMCYCMFKTPLQRIMSAEPTGTHSHTGSSSQVRLMLSGSV